MPLDNIRTHTASRRCFLLLADSDDNRLLCTSKLLERFQYEVLSVTTGKEALEAITAITPVLVITAQQLGDMSGLDLIRHLKKDHEMRRVPVIVLVSEKDPSTTRTLLAAGAVTCLPIPVSIEDLYRVIQVAIEPVPRMNMRIKTKLPVTIQNRAVDCEEGGCARTLSENGLYIRTDKLYPLRTILPVQIQLGDHLISAEAMVIYCRKNSSGQKQGMGLQFVEISRQDQMRIRVFIRNEIIKDIRRG